MIHPKIKSFLKPKTIVFSNGKSLIDQLILTGQNLYWSAVGKKSQWTHIGFVGTDNKFHESTIRIVTEPKENNFLGIKIKTNSYKLINGAQSSSLEERFEEKYVKNTYNFFGFQTLNNVSDKDWEKITKEAIKMEKNKYQYAIFENIGTLINIIRWRFIAFILTPKEANKVLQEYNIFDEKKQIYCCAFVSDAIENVLKKEYIIGNNSVSTVDGAWWTPLENTKSEIIKI